MLKKRQEKLKTLITEANTINTYNKDYSNQKHTTHTQKHMASEWMSDQWKKKISQTEYYTHTKVKLQIDGEMLVHLIVNDVAISYSFGENIRCLTHVF